MAKKSIKKLSESQSVPEANLSSPEVTPDTVGLAPALEAPALTLGAPALEQELHNERKHIARSATLVMLGNLGSSVMGMLRQIVVVATGPYVAGPFFSALVPAQAFFDLLINGSVSGALIPTFTDYTAPEKRAELRRLVFTIVNLVFLVMLAAALLFLLFSPWIVDHMVGYDADQKLLTLHFSQIIIFSLLALGPFAVLLSALYALKEFGWPAFATAAYHVGIMIGAVLGAWVGVRYHGRMGLAVGVLIGALGEIALLLPGIRRQRLRYMFVLDLKHPALRRILKLYAPVAFSFLVSTGLVFLDQYLATHTPGSGAANFSAMRAATTLVQFPIGLVAAALSFAVLPTLSAHATARDTERFKETLLLGIRVGLLLMIPAALGLIVLQEPIVRLLFQHHHNSAQNADLIALALQNYAPQLPFVALDQLLIAAFYARKNTIIPVVVYVVSLLGYLMVALPFWQTIGMPALAFANTVQNSLHAIILLVILRVALGSLHVRKMLPTILKILVAVLAMCLVAWGSLNLVSHMSLFSLNALFGQFLTVIVCGGLASLVYIGLVLLLRVEEVTLLKGAVMARLGRKDKEFISST